MQKKNKILYIGFAIPDSIQNEVELSDTYPHFSTNKFSWSVVRSIGSSFESVYIISSAQIRNYPTAKKIIFKSKNFVQNKFEGFFVGFINLILFKHLSRILVLFFRVRKIIKARNITHAVIHGTHTPFMFIAIWVKFFFNIKISILLTDQHGIEVASDGILGRIFRQIDGWMMRLLLKRFDAFICLSEIFIDKYNLAPAIVIPGILSNDFLKNSSINNLNAEKQPFTILFAGGINKFNGIDILLSAIKEIPIEFQILFVFLGNGDLVEKVKEASISDARIVYSGVKHGDDLENDLLKANMFINPRPVNEEYSRTSFPSKLIEYMACGIPTLTTKLESIPKEIEDCFFYIDSPVPSSIAKSIIKVYSLTPMERISVGQLAQKKVRQLYDEKITGKKIQGLLTK